MESNSTHYEGIRPAKFIADKILLIIILFAAIIAILYFALNVYNNVGYTPDQPIAFSHKIHAGDYNIDCLYCHSGAEKGPHANIPSMQLCMGCHSVVAIDKPTIQELTKIYNDGKAIEWVRVHRLPDHSYFNHKWHVNAGVECETCHGEVSEMAVIGQVNRLEMGDCLTCHRNSDYSNMYAQRLTPGDNTSIANNLKRYPYLKYINELTLESSKKENIRAIPLPSDTISTATGIFPHHNASVQCNICHN
jgi:Cytochrome c7 and related cytochrome c